MNNSRVCLISKGLEYGVFRALLDMGLIVNHAILQDAEGIKIKFNQLYADECIAVIVVLDEIDDVLISDLQEVKLPTIVYLCEVSDADNEKFKKLATEVPVVLSDDFSILRNRLNSLKKQLETNGEINQECCGNLGKGEVIESSIMICDQYENMSFQLKGQPQKVRKISESCRLLMKSHTGIDVQLSVPPKSLIADMLKWENKKSILDKRQVDKVCFGDQEINVCIDYISSSEELVQAKGIALTLQQIESVAPGIYKPVEFF